MKINLNVNIEQLKDALLVVDEVRETLYGENDTVNITVLQTYKPEDVKAEPVAKAEPVKVPVPKTIDVKSAPKHTNASYEVESDTTSDVITPEIITEAYTQVVKALGVDPNGWAGKVLSGLKRSKLNGSSISFQKCVSVIENKIVNHPNYTESANNKFEYPEPNITPAEEPKPEPVDDMLEEVSATEFLEMVKSRVVPEDLDDFNEILEDVKQNAKRIEDEKREEDAKLDIDKINEEIIDLEDLLND